MSRREWMDVAHGCKNHRHSLLLHDTTLSSHSRGIWLTGNGWEDLSFDGSIFYSLPSDGQFFIIFLFFWWTRLICRLNMPFFWLVTGAKRSLGWKIQTDANLGAYLLESTKCGPPIFFMINFESRTKKHVRVLDEYARFGFYIEEHIYPLHWRRFWPPSSWPLLTTLGLHNVS